MAALLARVGWPLQGTVITTLAEAETYTCQVACPPFCRRSSWPAGVRIGCRTHCTGYLGPMDPCATVGSQRGSCTEGCCTCALKALPLGAASQPHGG